jgi:DNA-binding NarL/FixJ family response regulator
MAHPHEPTLAMAASDSQAEIRVVLVINVRLYRDGLTETLSTYPRLDVSAVSMHDAAAAFICEHNPDVAVLDMSAAGAFDLLRDLQEQAAGTRVIAFAIDEDVSTVVECARAGAAGYVTVDASVADLADAIVRAARGELLCTPKMTAALFRRVGELDSGSSSAGGMPPEAADDAGLTIREREVLALLSPGLSNKAIASALNISEATVKNHVHNLLHKLKVERRQQAAAMDPTVHKRFRSRTSRS